MYNPEDERRKYAPSNWNNLSTREVVSGLMNGQMPITRNKHDVNKGMSETYYLDGNGNESDRPIWEQEGSDNNLNVQGQKGVYGKDVLGKKDVSNLLPESNINKDIRPNFVDFDKVYSSERDSKGNFLYKGTDFHEGGYSNRLNDDGRETHYGITQAALDEYKNWDSPLKTVSNLPESVANLTHDQSKKIMNEMYFQRYGLNKIRNISLARHMFDQTINPGPTSIKSLQKELNHMTGSSIPITGFIGNQTNEVINQLNSEQLQQLNDNMAHQRLKHYFQRVEAKPKNMEYINGWVNRGCSYFSDPVMCEPYQERLKRLKKGL